MQLLATLFPWLAIVAGLAIAVFAVRLNRRLSRGSQNAGPRDIVRPDPVGLEQTPWELQALHDQVRLPPGNSARRELIHTINRLSEAAGIDDPNFVLHQNAGDDAIHAIISHLEQRLELPPLSS